MQMAMAAAGDISMIGHSGAGFYSAYLASNKGPRREQEALFAHMKDMSRTWLQCTRR
jgi:hypothetical protein